MEGGKIQNRELYPIILVLGSIFFYILFKLSSMLKYFPLRGFVDGTSYMGRLFLMDVFGYHGWTDVWHNGFFILKAYAPGWFFFALPIYQLTNIEIASFLSMIIIFLASLYLLIRLFNVTKGIAFFLLFFLSPAAFVNFFVLGRLSDLFSVLFLILGFLFIYKKYKLDIKDSLIFLIIFSLILINQPSFTILFLFLLLGFFWNLKWKSRIHLMITGLVSLVITSFWWIPFLDSEGTVLASFKGLEMGNFISFGSIIAILFLVSSYFYLKKKRDIKFYLPSLVLAFLYLTQLLTFIPVLDKIWPNSYNLFFTFLTLYFIFNIDWGKLKKLVSIGVYLVPLLFIGIFLLYPVDSFEYTEKDQRILDTLNEIEGRFIIYGKDEISNRNLLVYATIYYGLETPDGWVSFDANDKLYFFVEESKEVKDCGLLSNRFKLLEIDEVLGLGEGCEVLKECMEVKVDNGDVCVNEVNW